MSLTKRGGQIDRQGGCCPRCRLLVWRPRAAGLRRRYRRHAEVTKRSAARHRDHQQSRSDQSRRNLSHMKAGTQLRRAIVCLCQVCGKCPCDAEQLAATHTAVAGTPTPRRDGLVLHLMNRRVLAPRTATSKQRNLEWRNLEAPEHHLEVSVTLLTSLCRVSSGVAALRLRAINTLAWWRGALVVS